MPRPDFFARLGLFVVRGFLDSALSAQLREKLRAVPMGPTKVINVTEGERVDEGIRRSKQAQVEASTASLVIERLQALRSQMEERFQVPLGHCEEPQFLVYREGDFFAAHRDSNDDPRARQELRKRRISVVIFLNGQSGDGEPDSFSGGALILYGLIDSPEWKNYGFPLEAEPGLLIAFPAEVFHEVEAVTRGQRFSVVSWFPDAGAV